MLRIMKGTKTTFFCLQITFPFPFPWRTTTTNIFTDNTGRTIQLLLSNMLSPLQQEVKLLKKEISKEMTFLHQPKSTLEPSPSKRQEHRTQECLSNHSMRKVTDIAFASDHNSNNSDFPLYIIIVCSLQYYNDSALFPNNPNWVPLVPIWTQYKFGCCTPKHFPLQLCYAKTVHQNSGSVSRPAPELHPPYHL
jgi:hypothetical protein